MVARPFDVAAARGLSNLSATPMVPPPTRLHAATSSSARRTHPSLVDRLRAATAESRQNEDAPRLAPSSCSPRQPAPEPMHYKVPPPPFPPPPARQNSMLVRRDRPAPCLHTKTRGPMVTTGDPTKNRRHMDAEMIRSPEDHPSVHLDSVNAEPFPHLRRLPPRRVEQRRAEEFCDFQ